MVVWQWLFGSGCLAVVVSPGAAAVHVRCVEAVLSAIHSHCALTQQSSTQKYHFISCVGVISIIRRYPYIRRGSEGGYVDENCL